nr:unnamed protein product [Callosobruchus analis]
MRQAISPKLKLQVTLRYLATGDSFSALASVYKVPKNTISTFLGEGCKAIYDVLMDFIKVNVAAANPFTSCVSAAFSRVSLSHSSSSILEKNEILLN